MAMDGHVGFRVQLPLRRIQAERLRILHHTKRPSDSKHQIRTPTLLL